jgi:glutathione synthase/RimK-type ligase-like ATP-grasp enzyme
MKKPMIGFYRNKLRPGDGELKIYQKILDHNWITFTIMDSSQSEFWDKIKDLDLFIFKWGHDHHSSQIALTILPVIENYLKIKCFPNLATCWHYDDKIKQYFLLKQSGFPAVDSFVFWDKKAAKDWLQHYNDFPLVFKLRNGAGSHSVFIVSSKKKAERMVNKMFGRGILQSNTPLMHLFKTLNFKIVDIFKHYAVNFRNNYLTMEKKPYWLLHKNYIYFQRFMPNNQWDTRVTTAGNRAHAFRRMNRPNDFRASGSNVWDLDPDKIDIRMVKIALDVSKYFGFQGIAYDFVYDENRTPKIVEMSYLYGGSGYPDFMNGYWDENLNWHEGRYWPQYFELMDLLNIPDLKLPELNTSTAYKKANIIGRL